MSWLTGSITKNLEQQDSYKQQINDNNSVKSPTRGVKQDLSEISETLTRQFCRVASFLAPNERSEQLDLEAPIAGIRRDFAEIKKLASEFLEFDDDDYYYSSESDGEGVVGVTDDVVDFVSDIIMHPQTWLDFPLPEDEDFDLSDAQREHALAVERLVPRLSALRIELCPNYMNESSFWKIYFVLLHPRLESEAAELLSTPNIVKARALLTHELKNRSCYENMYDCKSKCLPLEVSATETVKHPIKSDDDVQIVDKSVIQEDSHEVKDEDDRLKEESPEIVTNRIVIHVENIEDVSFSDLEDDDDDDDGNIPIHYKNATYAYDSSTKDSKIRLQLNQSSTDRKDSDSSAQVSIYNSEKKESNGWLNVVDIDVA